MVEKKSICMRSSWVERTQQSNSQDKVILLHENTELYIIKVIKGSLKNLIGMFIYTHYLFPTCYAV